MRLCCWRFLVCLVTAWCLLALARWTATTMTSGASATQQAMALSGQSAVHFFSFLFCLFWPASGQTSCLPHPRLSPQGPEGRYAAPTAGLPSTQGLSEQRHGGCSRGTSCTLHGEEGTEVENTKPLPTLLTTTHWHFSWKWVGSAGVFPPIIEISSTYCTPWCQWRLWWRFLIHVTIRRGCPKLGTE